MCRFAYTLRTFAEQDALFNAKPQVTKAKGGQSYHNYGLAIKPVELDVKQLTDEQIRQLKQRFDALT